MIFLFPRTLGAEQTGCGLGLGVWLLAFLAVCLGGTYFLPLKIG